MALTPGEAQRERLGELYFQEVPANQRKRPAPIPKEAVGGPRTMDNFPLKFSQTLERNQKLMLCCRHMENMQGQLWKTAPDLPGPDLFIATCQECGRNHYRLAVGGS